MQRKLRYATIVACALSAAFLLSFANLRGIKVSGCSMDTPTVAVLLVGDYNGPQDKLMVAYRAIHASVVQPFAADVFAVTSANTRNHHEAASSVFGTNLKAFRLVPNEGCQYDTNVIKDNVSRAVPLCAAPREYADAIKPGRFLQWHKLQAAWMLMQTFEDSHDGKRYNLTIKLRPDAVPLRGPDPSTASPWRIWQSCPLHSGHDGGGSAKLYAASDFAFFGDRKVMQAAADVYGAMAEYFQIARPDQLGRQVAVAPLLRSVQNAPPQSWTRETWEFYNKIPTLPYIEMSSLERKAPSIQRPSKVVVEGLDAYQRMEDGLNQAVEASIVVGDPERPGSSRSCSSGNWHLAANSRRSCWNLMVGPIYSRWDYRHAAFTSEKDFLAWMINVQNVTVCDFGLGTDHFLYKGEMYARPSHGCGPETEN